MQDEIFGPILPIVQYKEARDAIAYINTNPRPLALYVFSDDQGFVSRSSSEPPAATRRSTTRCCTTPRTTCPSVASASGMGAYHGEEGFLSLSHAKGVFVQSRWSFAGLLRAPFGRAADLILNFFLR